MKFLAGLIVGGALMLLGNAFAGDAFIVIRDDVGNTFPVTLSQPSLMKHDCADK